METISQFLILAIIFCNFFLLFSHSTKRLVNLAAIQGMLAAFLPLLNSREFFFEPFIFALIVIILKGFFFPSILKKIIVKNSAYEEKRREYYGHISWSMYLLIFFVSVWLSTKLNFDVETSAWILPASFMTIFCGFLTIILKSQTVSQITGYIVLENGIYCFGTAIFIHQPLMVEAAILLDIFVAIFVMGMAVFHIGREFKDSDSDSLDELREVFEEEAQK